MSLLACRGLTRRPWFEGRDLDLAKGEIAVLQGPTGSGKTLFLRALADLDPVDSGEVTLAGLPRTRIPPPEWRRKVLYLRQRAASLGETVREDLERVLALSGSPERREQLPETIPLDRATPELSGGEAQWLALERALLVEPEVLLLDEASSALDSELARRFEERIRSWVALGHAALWVAHDAQLAARLGAREIAFP